MSRKETQRGDVEPISVVLLLISAVLLTVVGMSYSQDQAIEEAEERGRASGLATAGMDGPGCTEEGVYTLKSGTEPEYTIIDPEACEDSEDGESGASDNATATDQQGGDTASADRAARP